MEKKSKIIVVLGQTSTGKSDFAVEIAEQVGGEIISADSRQVYKGMDLGTGKITKKEMRGVPHHLLDIYSPSKIFTVNDFQKMALKKMAEIIERGKVPIICGGTGFYIDAVVDGVIFPDVPPSKELREELSKKSKEELLKILIKFDKIRAENIDQNNPVRLIRAIEIAKYLGKVPKINKEKSKYQFLKVGLELPPEILKEGIMTRLLYRMKKGMIKEVESLHEDGTSWKRLETFGLEYRYVALFLQNKLKKDEMIEKLYTDIWHFAKRQKTWFKRNKNTIWIDPRNEKEKSKTLEEIKKFLG